MDIPPPQRAELPAKVQLVSVGLLLELSIPPPCPPAKRAVLPLNVQFAIHAGRVHVLEVNPRASRTLPFLQKANRFDKRYLEWDGDPNQLPTKDKRFIWVNTYARWRITDPLLYFQRLRDERGAQARLDDILDGETRNAIASYDLIEIVRSSDSGVGELLFTFQRPLDDPTYHFFFGSRAHFAYPLRFRRSPRP